MKTIAFVNNRGGTAKAFFVYHLAHMYADQQTNVLVADLDPQANLTGMFIEEQRLEKLWGGRGRRTVYGALEPLLSGGNDLAVPRLEYPEPGIGLLAGDLRLTVLDDEAADRRPDGADDEPRAHRTAPVLRRVLRAAAEEAAADLVLMEVGPGLGPLNQAALIASDYAVFPLAPDPYHLQGLHSLGNAMRAWRGQWRERVACSPADDAAIPDGPMRPVGYVVCRHAIRFDRPVASYARWQDRIPGVYAQAVCGQPPQEGLTVSDDPGCIGVLGHFRSLMHLAQEARRPLFALKPGDGVFGGHTQAVMDSYRDFRELTRAVSRRTAA